jgi:hypothetical protein
MSLISATLAASESVRALTLAVGRAGASVRNASASARPDVVVTIGSAQSADAYARIFTRLDESVGMSRGDLAASEIYRRAFTQDPIVGLTRADRIASDIYRLVFASPRGLNLPGYSTGGR